MSQLINLHCCENHIKPADYHKDAADFFYDYRSFGLFVPVEVLLNKLCKCARCHDNRTVADSIG